MSRHPLFELLQRLEIGGHHFMLSRCRPDTVLITVCFVGERAERAEIDVFEDGHMEVSRFRGSEAIAGEADLVWQLVDAHTKRDAA